MSESTSLRKTYKYKLQPTPEQVQCFAQTVRFCRELYNAGLQERRDAWRMQHVSLNRIAQNAELPGVKEVRPEGALIHSQVLQDVMMRLDRTWKRVLPACPEW
jgi:putative transposase